MMLKTEDHGIDRVLIRSIEGVRIASTTSIQMLMKSDFDLVINDFVYRVQPPPFEVGTGLSTLDDNEVRRMGDVRALVGELYEALHVEEYQAVHEQKLVRELEAMRDELAPLEDSRKILVENAERRTQNLTWLGHGFDECSIWHFGKTYLVGVFLGYHGAGHIFRNVWNCNRLLRLLRSNSSRLSITGRRGSSIFAQLPQTCSQK